MGAEEDPVLQEPLLGAAAQTDTRTKNSSIDYVSESHGKTRKLLSRRWLLAGSFVMFFAANLSASLASPFLPQELMDLGASSSTVGIVFAAYPFSFFVNSLITGMQYIPWGRGITKADARRRPILAVLGWTVEGCFTILSGFVTTFKSFPHSVRVWLYFSCQVVQGFGRLPIKCPELMEDS
eukprot:scaffold952_cov409-Prasinococcus_capsulatus_cf.AAC.26